MATSQYTYHPFHTIGAATVLLWDSAAGGGSGAWRQLGKAADAALIMSTEQAGKDICVKGLTQPIARRNRAKRYSISFRLLEDANPLTLDLLYSEGAALSSGGSELIATRELLRLYGADYSELAHPYGLRRTAPDAVSGLSASAAGSGGSIPPGSYYYWIVPYLGSPGGPLLHGAPLRVGPVSVGSGQKVSFEFTPPADYAPDGYLVYSSAGEALTGASLAGSGSGATILLGAHAGGAAYGAQTGPLLRLLSYDGQTEFAPGTDYLLDAAQGLLKRSAGGAIAEGQQLLAVYAYARPASVAVPLGDAVDLERYRRVKLLQLAADDPDPALWRETGVEFEFYKVNVSLGDSRWPFSENDFSEGASVTWDCLFDSEQAQVGVARSIYGVLAEYEG